MFGADFKGFDKAVKNATTKLNRFERNAKRLGTQLSTNLTLPILAVGAGAVKLASDFQESLNKVNVSFGESSKEVQAFAKTTLDNFGIAEGSALEMAALFGDMGTSIGLTDKEAASMSTTLVGLVGDLASFKNIRHDIAETALASVFTGETESLKKLGVIMTQANLQQFALEQGITKTIKQMTEAEKVQLRFNFVLARTTNAQGDYLNTIDGVANSTRNLQESVKELGAQFGTLLIPLTKDLVNSLKGIVDTLRGLTENQKEAIIFFSKLVAVIGPLVTILGVLAGAISSIIALFTSLTATTVAAVLGAIAAAAKFVITRFGGFKQSKTNVDNLTSSVKELKDITDQLGGGKRKLIFDPSGVKSKDSKTRPKGTMMAAMDSLPVQKLNVELSKIPDKLKNVEAPLRKMTQAQKELNAATQLFGDVMFNAMMDAANSQEGFFSSFVENMKKAIKQLLIQLAVMTAINILLGGKGMTLSKAFSAAKTSILGLQSGGLVTGPTMALVGEGAGTNASNPEVVAPLDKLKGMINGGSGSQQIEVFGRISGNDIFISNQRGALGRLRTV
jgi:hypothetical protein